MVNIEELADKLDSLLCEIVAAGYTVTIPASSSSGVVTTARVVSEQDWNGSKHEVITLE